MDSTSAALLALFVGIVIGAAIVGLLMISLHVRDRAEAAASRQIPDGIAAVLEGMDDAAAVVDTSLSVVAASTAASGFGVLAGGTLPSEELRAVARDARGSGAAATETLRLHRGTLPGDERLVAVRANSITPRLILLLLRDITERERVEEMRRDFVANTSHELKTPVGAITLLAEAVSSAADDPDQVRRFADRLSAEATRLGALTTRIMNLSRLQSSHELLETRDVSLDEVVTAAAESQAVAAKAAGITVVRGGARGVQVRGDVTILTDAVANLIANAIAYSPEGAQVGVGIKVVDGVAEIAVADSGIGIPEGDQPRIFERFYRADQARSRRTGGTGLGLSIVKHAVQRHGGEVVLWSRPGRGSTFTIRIPATHGPESPSAKTKTKKKSKNKKKMTAADPLRARAVDPATGGVGGERQ